MDKGTEKSLESSLSAGRDKNEAVKKVLYGIYAGGTIGWLLFFSLYFYKANKVIKEAVPFKAEWLSAWKSQHSPISLLLSDKVSTPFTTGLFKSKIIFPRQMADSRGELQHVLLHEMSHIEHQHILWKRLALLSVCLNWFNPMVWLMYHLFSKDLEIACDEQAVKRMNQGERKNYVLSLIHLSADQKYYFTLENNFGKSDIEERIGFIMKIKNKSKVLAAVIIGAGLLSVSISATAFSSKDRYAADVEASSYATTIKDKAEDTSYAENNSKAAYKAYGVAYNAEKDNWEMNGQIIAFLLDEGHHWYVNNSPKAIKSGLRLQVTRNQQEKITGIKKLNSEEVKALKKVNEDIRKNFRG